MVVHKMKVLDIFTLNEFQELRRVIATALRKAYNEKKYSFLIV